MPPGHKLRPLPLRNGGGGVVILKDIISKLLNCFKENGYFKILIGCVWENGGRGRGLVALQSLLTIRRGTSSLNFQSNEPFLKFL